MKLGLTGSEFMFITKLSIEDCKTRLLSEADNMDSFSYFTGHPGSKELVGKLEGNTFFIGKKILWNYMTTGKYGTSPIKGQFIPIDSGTKIEGYFMRPSIRRIGWAYAGGLVGCFLVAYLWLLYTDWKIGWPNIKRGIGSFLIPAAFCGFFILWGKTLSSSEQKTENYLIDFIKKTLEAK